MTREKTDVMVILLLTVFIGCSSTTNWPQFSGFLDNYKGMYRSNEIDGIFIIKHEEKNVNDYSKFLVDPVTVRLTPDARAYNIGKDELSGIAKGFRNEIKNALQTNYSVVRSPGTGVLRVRVAITDILKKGRGGSAKGIIEAEFVDTRTGERVAAIMTSDKGMYFDEWATILSDRLLSLNNATKTYKFK